ncbi:PREDICTED: phosphatidylinositol 3-kinase regulatory subunit gamma-like [Amphimedon queenslandica]|uniref:Uncharacterized protein n=1 Tax=Amphimedon queenslandica TaxID=400682 RepID=A0A1X7UGM6_AMPQE|nr:PREDICTED: phosphatidylinositol 3-kinase regulatory subunit gamma-like [Amphimedon queenslandica]|eukprot:XP_019854198.1 PREDICTED: phosphatidylinositol 3-kinase regulatory subunit gamma-like [Amphimedon queenslandica]
MIEERGLRVEGIYRVSASLGDVNKLKEELNRGVAGINVHDPRWSDIHIFSGALKLYLRDLPEPIFTYQMYPEFIKAGRSSKDYDTIYRNVQPLVDNLPAHNKLTLETLLTHLIKIVNEQHYNKMNHNNLALVFGPTLMRPKPDQIAELVGNCDVHCRVVDVLLQKGPWNIKPPDVSSLRGVKPINDAPPVPVRSRDGKRGSVPIAPRSSHVPVPEEADGPPPVTPPSSAPSIPLSECGWYWQDISREEVTAKLKDAPEGSFLVRDSQRGAYTLTVKKGGQNKLVRIISSNGLYGFSDPTQYRSVPDLIDHYREVSLSQYNPRLDVKLLHPVSRFAKISEEGVEEEEDEDRENDVEELLEKLKDVTELFDTKNEVYLEMEKRSELMKKELEVTRTKYSGFGNVAEMLKEQLDFLRHHDLTASILADRDRRCIMDNGKELGKRLEQAEACHRKALSDMRDCNNRFRALDRDLNTLRPDLMRLQWEKDQYTSKLVQEGLTHHEISERVKDKAMNESESIYGTLYGTLEGQDEDEEDGGIYEPPPEIQNIQYPGPPPPPRSGSRPPPPIPPTTRTPELGPAPPPALRKPSTGDRMPIPPPHTKTRVKPPVPTLEDRPHVRQETWYVECDRAHAEMHLRHKQDGTFLCRPSGKAMQNAKGGLHTHTIDIVYQGIKHLKVVQDSNKYGFSVPCNYSSLIDLVLHYSENSLETHNPKLTTTLAYPVYS